MTNALLTFGVLFGSFAFVACFAFIISLMARAKQRERLTQGIAFAMIRKEMSRFQGEIKRLVVTPIRPTVEQMFELQDYYQSSECGSGWETEAIQYTFKNMQLLGYEVKLFRKGKKVLGEPQLEEVDLSKLYIKPCKEMKKEMRKNKKRVEGDDDFSDEGDEEKRPQVVDGGHVKQSNDNTFNGPNVTPQVIQGGADMSEIVPPIEEKKLGGFLQRAMNRMSAPKNPNTSQMSSAAKPPASELSKTNMSKSNKSKYLSSSSSGESVPSSSDSEDSSSSGDERRNKAAFNQKAKKGVSNKPFEDTSAKKPLNESLSPVKNNQSSAKQQIKLPKGVRSVNEAVKFHEFMEEYARLEREHHSSISNLGLGVVQQQAKQSPLQFSQNQRTSSPFIRQPSLNASIHQVAKPHSVFSGLKHQQVTHLNSSPSKPVGSLINNVILNTQSNTDTNPGHNPGSTINAAGGAIEKGDISSLLDDSHVPLDHSLIGIDHNDYMDDVPSQYSKKPTTKFGKKKGKKGLSKPISSFSGQIDPTQGPAGRDIQSFTAFNIQPLTVNGVEDDVKQSSATLPLEDK